MSSNQYGLPLAKPITQSILPIVMPDGRLYGFYPISEHTFTGTETSFALSQGSVPITTVTLAPKVYTNVYDEQRVEQYMAAQWPSNTEGVFPWRGYEELVTVDQPQNIGTYSWWSMPVNHIMKHFGRGILWNALMFNMNQTPFVPTPPEPPVVTTPQVLQWATSLNQQAFSQDCAFIDFNWVNLFQAVIVSDPSQEGNGVVPMSISTVSNPTGGYFKASVVTGATVGQTIYPGGGAVFNTVRILRLQDPPAGTYTFNFNITYTLNGSNTMNVPAVLTLTVV